MSAGNSIDFSQITTYLNANIVSTLLKPPSKDKEDPSKKAFSDLVGSAVTGEAQTAVLSAMGKTIDQVYRAAQASGKTEVVEGVKIAIQRLQAGNDPLRVISFFHNAKEMADSNPTTFENTFSNIYALEQNHAGNFFSSYIDALNTTYSDFGVPKVDSLNTSLQSIFNADYTHSTAGLTDNLFSFFDTYHTILSADPKKIDRGQYLDELTKGVDNQNTGDNANKFLTDFAEANNFKTQNP